MLTGAELGEAIEAARKLMGVSKKDLADAFGVKPPSVQDWVKRGTIEKAKLPALWAYFANVVGPAHWGLDAYPAPPGGKAAGPVRALPRRDLTPYELLELLGRHLARMPTERRAELGPLFQAWAQGGGAEDLRGVIAHRLDRASETNKRAG